MHPSRSLPVALVIIVTVGSLASSPASAATVQPLYESVARGYSTLDDERTLPRKVTLEQLVSSDLLAGVESVVLATGCEIQSEDESEESSSAKAPDRLGQVIATVRLLRADGSQVKLGKVKTSPESDDEVFGVKPVALPGGIQRGDRLEWTLKLKRFSAISAGREIELLAGVAHPALLDD